MQRLSQLPAPPDFAVEVVRARRPDEPAFLNYLSRHVRIVDSKGRRSRSLIYDEVDRPALDAVVIAAHFSATHEGARETFVVLRSAVRPPISLRDSARSAVGEPQNRGLWELPAGLIESGESDPFGVLRAAQRELAEETGFSVLEEELVELGPSVYPAPGVIAERQFFFRVEVDPRRRGVPTLDGSPLEEAGRLVAVPLRVALEAARQGRLPDSKTELALRRLAEVLSP